MTNAKTAGTVLAALGMTLASPAGARTNDWRLVSETSDQAILFDAGGLVRDGQRVAVSVAMVERISDVRTAFPVAVLQMSFDCQARTESIQGGQVFGEQGESVGSGLRGGEAAAPRPVGDAPLDRMMLEAACRPGGLDNLMVFASPEAYRQARPSRP